MTDSEKLAHVLTELKRVQLPDEKTQSSEYWDEVDCRVSNATDEVCDTDLFHKNLIKYIESDK